LAGEGAVKDGLAQALGAGQVGGDGLFHSRNDRQPPLDFGDDAFLFSEWWQSIGRSA
jgi:hypothetical protein